MDKLEQAMQSEEFWVELADTSFGKVTQSFLPQMTL